jgi:hypothetical protein
MQTTGSALIAVRLCSPVRMWMFAQGSDCAHGLLYLAAVRDNWREHKHLPGTRPNTLSESAHLGPAKVSSVRDRSCQFRVE